ncbi:TIGR03621 family F420-dependent LLM class oxidoreductase [Planomonospora venezuelensis]|uniref:Putative F420-dependent oxidoreductase n=1 Tax=Planomonospora venezuelensis TaxID=1999 RepID=A0A841D038_PLAVE|nr:TIGR03621 family F420-dependent LLM class oxidoreductase [Planomonospora venezuelensis]MBB5961617.1 putative F420-dependent oxidoreductase [Planomonospora venezuelensis]GIM98763.1 LLM class F420-dependent oxidoreductase [Planomonospora venezuelensis]
MDRPFRFAAVVRQASSGREWAEKARRLEGAGFDVLLVPDHLVGPRLAPVAAMTAAACATSRLKVGTLVFANDFRHPAVLAKEAATVDLLSEGRLELGLGTGWMAADYAAAGLALDPPGTRVDRLAEAIAVLKGLWGDGPFTFRGEHYRIDGLDQHPKPFRRPGPRLLLGGGGPRMLRLAAREADVINLGMRVRADGTGPDGADGGLAAFLAKIDVVRRAAAERYGAIELGTSVQQLGERRRDEPWSAADSSRQDETPQVLLGTRGDVADKLRHWRDTHDLSYYVLHHERDLEAFTPVVEELAGG